MSNYDPPQQPWGGPPQDPYGAPQYPQGAPQYPAHDPHAAPGYPPPTTQFPPGGGFPPPPGGGYPPPPGDPGYPPVSGGGYGAPAGGFPPPPGGGYGAPGGGFPPPPGGGYPGQQPRRGGGATKVILAIVGVVVLALCIGGGYTVYTLTSDDKDNAGSPTAGASATASGSARPSATASRTPAPTTKAPPAGGGDDPGDFVKGDCFTNQGTDDKPALKKVPCTTKGSYEILAKINLTSDKKACDGPQGPGAGKYDASYTHDAPTGTIGDYVFCLKQR